MNRLKRKLGLWCKSDLVELRRCYGEEDLEGMRRVIPLLGINNIEKSIYFTEGRSFVNHLMRDGSLNIIKTVKDSGLHIPYTQFIIQTKLTGEEKLEAYHYIAERTTGSSFALMKFDVELAIMDLNATKKSRSKYKTELASRMRYMVRCIEHLQIQRMSEETWSLYRVYLNLYIEKTCIVEERFIDFIGCSLGADSRPTYKIPSILPSDQTICIHGRFRIDCNDGCRKVRLCPSCRYKSLRVRGCTTCGYNPYGTVVKTTTTVAKKVVKKPYSLMDTISSRDPQYYCIVEGELFDSVSSMVRDTCNTMTLGKGRDSKGQNYSDIRVECLYDVIDSDMVEAYDFKAERMNQTPLAVNTDGLLEEASDDKLLFHGTTPKNAYTIIKRNFDHRIAGDGLFGKGIYFTESSSKADSYMTPDSDGLCWMIISKVNMGRYQNIMKRCQKRTRPPCFGGCDAEDNKTPVFRCSHPRYDSIVAESRQNGHHSAILHWYREFVIYDEMQCYPMYLVGIRRI